MPLVKIRVLGCHGSDQLLDGARGPLQCGTCGFLVNGTVLVDAGTIGSQLRLVEQKQIRHVLLSHLHFDHIKGLPTLADNLVGESDGPVGVAGIPEVLKGLEAHIFNGEVYPDFFRLPDPERPVFVSCPLTAGKEARLSGLTVIPVPVNHLVPTVGFVLTDGETTVLYSGDTYRTDQLWRTAAGFPTLKAAFIETSFPNEMEELARLTKHLTPALLAEEFRKIGRSDLALYVYHMKPRFRDRIIHELGDLNLPNLTVLEEGQEIVV